MTVIGESSAGASRRDSAIGAPPTRRATVDGWTLIAALHHRSGRPTTVQVLRSDAHVDIDGWSRSDGWCEHCRTTRERHTTYLLRHLDGQLAQVGSSCLADLTGSPPRPRGPAQHRRRGPTRASRERRRPTAGYVDTHCYLAHSAQSVIDSGFVSTGDSTPIKHATWEVAAASLDRGCTPSRRAQRRADDALNWVRVELPTRPELDEFKQRLVVLLAEDRLTRRELPTAAAAIYAYHQHLRRRIAARAKAGAHIGEPGATLTVGLTVQRIDRVATERGLRRRHRMTDELGRRVIWDSTTSELAVGTHQLEITVAEHLAEGDGGQVTIIDRCARAE